MCVYDFFVDILSNAPDLEESPFRGRHINSQFVEVTDMLEETKGCVCFVNKVVYIQIRTWTR